MLDTLRENWLTDDEYHHRKGIIEEYERVIAILEELEKKYYKASATSEIGLHPFRVAMREVRKGEPIV